MTRYYTGVGSRKAPFSILQKARVIGAVMARRGFKLRSGAADGMDEHFEVGCVEAGGEAEIFLPWSGFKGHRTGIVKRDMSREMVIANDLHWSKDDLGGAALKLHARNVNQVLGEDLLAPSEIVICYTPDGCVHHSTRTKETGGTGTAISVASVNDIPVINLVNPMSRFFLPAGFEFLEEFL